MESISKSELYKQALDYLKGFSNNLLFFKHRD